MTGDREMCLDAGADDYTVKPIQIASLREAIVRASRHQPKVETGSVPAGV